MFWNTYSKTLITVAAHSLEKNLMAKNFLNVFCSRSIEFDCVTHFALLFVVSSWIRYIHRNLWKTEKKKFCK